MTFSIVYLHGFASGPQSAKARFFRDYFVSRGIDFIAPDLNQPAFRTLTVSRIIAQAEAAAPARICVIGSSLGGFAAAHWAEQRPVLAQMLIAPAFDFHTLWPKEASGTIDISTLYGPDFSHIDDTIISDARQWAERPLQVRTPTLIFHGEADATVPVTRSRAFAAQHPNVVLETFPGAPHGLLAQMDLMADKTLAFFYSHAR